MEPEGLGAGGAHGFIRIIFPAPEENPFSSKEILFFFVPSQMFGPSTGSESEGDNSKRKPEV